MVPDAGVYTSDTVIAFNPDFANYKCWTSFHSDGPPASSGYDPVVLGPREQYINHVPPHGSSEFPVGTIIVENRESGKIFASVKRGGNFNSTGAVNWEWFELTDDPTMNPQVQIFWRGFGPPMGDTYGGDVTGGCNACHAMCGATNGAPNNMSNDFVCSSKLQLANF
jgi:hypothetical protein